jgi:hypothetical protein
MKFLSTEGKARRDGIRNSQRRWNSKFINRVRRETITAVWPCKGDRTRLPGRELELTFR